jgi:hypothetical protein
MIAASMASALEIYSIPEANGWWLDELWSLWATDPKISFDKVFLERIVFDTTPPPYYVFLFLVRSLITAARSVVILLNLGLIAAFAAAVILGSREREMMPWALIAIGAFLCSGPVLRYIIEGWAYVMAIVFWASWYSAFAVERCGTCNSRKAFAFLAIVAALTHVFAALFCCCLTVGLIAHSCLDHRPGLRGPGSALGTRRVLLARSLSPGNEAR